MPGEAKCDRPLHNQSLSFSHADPKNYTVMN
jgi:hypothetical protein